MATAAKTKKLKDKSYRLLGEIAPLTFLLQVGKNKKLLVFDKTKQRNRSVRHCPNEQSIFIDEQSDNAVCEPIMFLTGILDVDQYNVHTQEFMDNHPDNRANGGIWFEEIDEAAEATEDVETEELIQDIKNMIRNKYKEKDGVAKLEMVVSILFGSLDQAAKLTPDELKRVLYTEAEDNPKFFINETTKEVDVFDNELNTRKYITLRGLKNGIISKSLNGRSMVWGSDKKNIIYTAPVGKDLTESFANYLETDEGILVMSELIKN
jgi:hypothetical protein